MNILLKLSTQLFGQWMNSTSRRFSHAIRNILLSSFVNNILGNIAAISLIAIIFTSTLILFNYPIDTRLQNATLITSLTLFFCSLCTMSFLTRTKKIEKLIGVDTNGPIFDQSSLATEIIPLVKDFMDQKISREDQKVGKLEEALITTTEVLQELEDKITNLEKINYTNKKKKNTSQSKDVH